MLRQAKARPLTTRQAALLVALRTHGPWHAQARHGLCDASVTRRVLRSLEARGVATKETIRIGATAHREQWRAV